jgi:rhodanese-related sulfurtransferase
LNRLGSAHTRRTFKEPSEGLHGKRRGILAAIAAFMVGAGLSSPPVAKAAEPPNRADSPSERTQPDSVSPQEAQAAVLAHQAILIDIREADEVASGVAPGARWIPSKQALEQMPQIAALSSVPVLLICNTQNRSRSLLKTLREKGSYANVHYVAGGMTEWRREGLPVVKLQP